MALPICRPEKVIRASEVWSVLQFCHMGNTLSVRLPKPLLDRLRRIARESGLPVGKLVRETLETTLSQQGDNLLLEFSGVIKGGPRDLSSRKGFSTK